MIELDLKLTLWLGLLLGLALIGGLQWLAWRQAVLRATHTQHRIATHLPLALVLFDARGTQICANPPARRLLATHGDALSAALRTLVTRADDASSPYSGALQQPCALRWWRIPLDTGATLIACVDWSDQQRLVRQQQTFIGHLAHELRTPLTALSAHIELARSPQSSPALRDIALHTIERETQRMARLVRELLELHRLETADELALRPTDVVLVAEEAIAQVILLAEARGLDLGFETDAHLPPVLAEPDRLKQVFLNLLDNALKYCRPGDRILVTLRREQQGVRCTVRDSGPGIPAADLPRVTERLYRGRADREGAGLGLALVQEILRQHHSHLQITSTTDGPATGTICAWTLPYAPSPLPTEAEAHARPAV
ncbi:sensor histidine kinase [Kallotenue papyrolyticum]|uniref:sensor histidine kinase n=1 Tax=Kallotenue papyrolyticum TaxID=1325125 RepID=UPI0004785806|nr:HAMP domain-containing sensor histidine kinase [Kallotenue papyrolyticum]